MVWSTRCFEEDPKNVVVSKRLVFVDIFFLGLFFLFQFTNKRTDLWEKPQWKKKRVGELENLLSLIIKSTKKGSIQYFKIWVCLVSLKFFEILVLIDLYIYTEKVQIFFIYELVFDSQVVFEKKGFA